jgi:hypothetical protein
MRPTPQTVESGMSRVVAPCSYTWKKVKLQAMPLCFTYLETWGIAVANSLQGDFFIDGPE